MLIRSLFRLRVVGVDALPPTGQIVLTPTHSSFLDPLVLAAALPPRRLRETYWGGWTGIGFGNPLARAARRLARVLPVDPERGVMSSLAYGAEALRRGHSLVWFPEGERSASGELLPFRPGIGLLLERYPAPVVPVFIYGSHEALPPRKKWPRLRRITVAFGPALAPDELARRGAGETASVRIVHALHDAVGELGRTAPGERRGGAHLLRSPGSSPPRKSR